MTDGAALASKGRNLGTGFKNFIKDPKKSVMGFLKPGGKKGILGKSGAVGDGRFKTRGSLLEKTIDSLDTAAKKMNRSMMEKAPFHVLIKQTTNGINSLEIVKNEKSRFFSKGGEGSSGKKGKSEGISTPPVYVKVNYGDHFTKKGRKKALKPNVEYTSPDGYTYRTDSQGRIIECEGSLQLGAADRSEYAQRTVGGKDRLPDDDGGHLIGAQFKGPKDIDNLVPQNSQINRSGGEWFNMETVWANALKEVPPKKVSVKIEPVYSGNSMRPDSFEVIYQIEGKRPVQKTIKNQAGG
ncbi:DNA/RNA non-specific endonuclease [Paenibacillus azoreducens]|nr:DNA/RNA non-specific endonuclease [Paenibacillus azoreducens]